MGAYRKAGPTQDKSKGHVTDDVLWPNDVIVMTS